MRDRKVRFLIPKNCESGSFKIKKTKIWSDIRILAKKNLGLTTNFCPKTFDPQKMLVKNSFWMKKMLSEIFFSANIFFSQNYFWPTFFGSERFLDQNMFFSQFFFVINFFVSPKNFVNIFVFLVLKLPLPLLQSFEIFWMWNLGSGTRDLRPGILDWGSGNWDLVPRLLLTNLGVVQLSKIFIFFITYLSLKCQKS